jgi:hypothetical protein
MERRCDSKSGKAEVLFEHGQDSNSEEQSTAISSLVGNPVHRVYPEIAKVSSTSDYVSLIFT